MCTFTVITLQRWCTHVTIHYDIQWCTLDFLACSWQIFICNISSMLFMVIFFKQAQCDRNIIINFANYCESPRSIIEYFAKGSWTHLPSQFCFLHYTINSTINVYAIMEFPHSTQRSPTAKMKPTWSYVHTPTSCCMLLLKWMVVFG